MPAYNSQLVSNSPLVSAGRQDIAPVYCFKNESPLAGEASIAVPIVADDQHSGQRDVSFTFESLLGVGAGVYEIWESDDDTKGLAGYSVVAFGGASPGQVVAASFITAGGLSAKVTLQLRTRFVLVYCVIASANPISVGVSA
jgi:hypothetical protein